MVTPEMFEELLKGPIGTSIRNQLDPFEWPALDARIGEYCDILAERKRPYGFELFKDCLENFYLHCIRLIPLDKTGGYTSDATYVVNWFTEDDYKEQVNFMIEDFKKNGEV